MIIKHDVPKCGGMITECTDLGEIQKDISSCCFDVGKHGLSVKLPKYYKGKCRFNTCAILLF